MAITLTADVGTSDPTIFVSEPLALGSGQPPQLVMVGAEAMYVANPGGLAWSVLRGANLTSPASHSAGDTVTPTSTAGEPSDVGVIGGVPFFVSATDPTTVPALAPLVVPGAVWVDTSFGPPFQQFSRDGSGVWQTIDLIAYDNAGAQQARLLGPSSAGSVAMFGGGRVGAHGNITAQTTAAFLLWSADPDETAPIGIYASAQGLTVTGLPTADPLVAGALWSNLGIVTVSAG
jgi:hypothetical protein